MKILVLNPFGIGDVLFATPLVRALKEQNKDHYVAFICNRRVGEILETNPNVDELFIFEKDEYRALAKKSKFGFLKSITSFLWKLKSRKFDVVIDLSLNSQYGFFMRLLGIPKRAGLDYKNRGRFLTHKLPIEGFSKKHVAEYYLDTLRMLGFEVLSSRVEVFVKPEDFKSIDDFLAQRKINSNHQVIGLLPGGGMTLGQQKKYFKRWPIEQFIALAQKLTQNAQVRVVVSCAPDENELAEAFRPYEDGSIAVFRPTGLRESAAMMKRCEVIVANDGGPLHLAVAASVPTVSLFGPTDERVYGPYSTQSIHKVLTRDIHCRPCYKKFRFADCDHRNCLTYLDEDRVLKEVHQLIETRSKVA